MKEAIWIEYGDSDGGEGIAKGFQIALGSSKHRYASSISARSSYMEPRFRKCMDRAYRAAAQQQRLLTSAPQNETDCLGYCPDFELDPRDSPAIPAVRNRAVARYLLGYFKICVQSKLAIEDRRREAHLSKGFHVTDQSSSLVIRCGVGGRRSGCELLGADEDDDHNNDDDATLELQGLTFGCSTPRDDDSTVARDAAPAPKRLKLDKHSSLRLACPFLKHNPETYHTSRACAWSGWPSVHRVKCTRCGQDFKLRSQLSDHQRSEISCPVVPQSHEGVIGEDQLQMLRSRKGQSALSEEEKWIRMYRVIFPDDDIIPSPYHELSDIPPEDPPRLAGNDSGLLEKMHDYVDREGPQLIKPGLDDLLDDARHGKLDRDKITKLAQDFAQQVIRNFKSQDTPPQPGNAIPKYSPKQSDSMSSTLGAEGSSTLGLTSPQLDAANPYHMGTSCTSQPTTLITDFGFDEHENFEFLFENLDPLSFPAGDQDLLHRPEQ
ncbi:hypothetical protein NUW58_g3751 [Xylaria curta]|uniref:Uncharacterized protein n=1 Tax=Xylaria curta TaxID=42375 RepID=A0ACC1PC80_9PEZI|nr:hypothetical protein NUW58_g3751 [Xylaria curta]